MRSMMVVVCWSVRWHSPLEAAAVSTIRAPRACSTAARVAARAAVDAVAAVVTAGADCGTCDGCSGPPCCGIRPVRWVLGVLGFQCAPACTGCGEEYWGDWCSSPPDCCDPCDQCGNYVGPQGPACAAGQCADPGYAAQPRATRTVAKAPRRPAATLASQRVVQQSEPEILSESDEAIEPVSTTTDWQARRTRPAAIQR